jgi:hypothetical protein
MGNHVFICYARENEQFVFTLATQLKSRGVPVWLDQWDIPGGANWLRSFRPTLKHRATFTTPGKPGSQGGVSPRCP